MPLPLGVLNPIELTAVNQSYDSPARILALVWFGTTTAADTVDIRHQGGDKRIWKGQTDSTNTYLGISFGNTGLGCPNGFILKQISSGTLLVYISEE